FFFSSRRRHTRFSRDWSSDVCSSDLSIYFASIIAAIMTVPLGEYKGIISFEGDFIFFAYILGLGKFFSIISALDTGSSFEGMGRSEERRVGKARRCRWSRDEARKRGR